MPATLVFLGGYCQLCAITADQAIAFCSYNKTKEKNDYSKYLKTLCVGHNGLATCFLCYFSNANRLCHCCTFDNKKEESIKMSNKTDKNKICVFLFEY